MMEWARLFGRTRMECIRLTLELKNGTVLETANMERAQVLFNRLLGSGSFTVGSYDEAEGRVADFFEKDQLG